MLKYLFGILLLAFSNVLFAQHLILADSIKIPLTNQTYRLMVDHSSNIIYSGDMFDSGLDVQYGGGVIWQDTNNNHPYNHLIAKYKNDTLLWSYCLPAKGCRFAVDNHNNIIVLGGSYGNNVDLDPGPGVHLENFGNLPGKQFLLKLDSNGNYINSKIFNSATTTFALSGNCMDIDHDDNIIFYGLYSNQNLCTPIGVPPVYLNSINGSFDFAIKKFDSSLNFLWAKSIGGSGDEKASNFSNGKGFSFDSDNNIYVIGEYEDTADFDPGIGVYNLTELSQNISGESFVAKYTPNGDLVFAHAFPTLVASLNLSTITVDHQNKILIGGRNSSPSVDFDFSAAVKNTASYGGFILKLDSNGNFNNVFDFSKPFYSSAFNDNMIRSIAVDDSNNYYFLGLCNVSAVDLDPTPSGSLVPLPNSSTANQFFGKIKNTGELIWGRAFQSFNGILSTLHNAASSLYIIGNLASGGIDMDPNPNSVYTIAPGVWDLSFIAKYDDSCPYIPMPNVTISNTCASNIITLSASSTSGFNLWSTQYTTLNYYVLNNVQSQSVQMPASSNNFYYWVKDSLANGCTSTNKFDSVIKDLGPAISTVNYSICKNDSVSLSPVTLASGNYCWYSALNNPPVFIGDPYTIYNVTNNMQLYVKDSVNSGCNSILKPVFITILNPNTPVITNNSTTLSISGTYPNIDWQYNGTTVASNVNSIPIMGNGTYIVTVLENGCSSSDTLILTTVSNSDYLLNPPISFSETNNDILINSFHPFEKSITLFSFDGRIVEKIVNYQLENRIDKMHIAEGIYFLHYSDKLGRKKQQKILVRHF